MHTLHATATMHRREMNHTERQYAKHLQERLLVGEIRWWAFECWKFRLADDTFYTPDFIVVTNDLKIEAHEVKAYWKSVGKPGWTDDARVKIKVASEQHPVRFIAVALLPDLSWQVEQFQGEREDPPAHDYQADLRQLGNALHLPPGLGGAAPGIEKMIAAIRKLEGDRHRV